jgi:hypothetical protein
MVISIFSASEHGKKKENFLSVKIVSKKILFFVVRRKFK